MTSVNGELTLQEADLQPPAAPAVAEWHILARLEKTAIGARLADGTTTVRRREPAGCLLFGPYWQLPAGAYRLGFRCRAGKPRFATQPVLGIEVIALNRIQLAWRDLTAVELEADSYFLDFSIPPALGMGTGDEARLEFRFVHMGNADLTITAVDLRAIEQEEARPAPARRWRMLGRLETTVMRRRAGAGVTVRRAARPGRVLHGGRPPLQLPAGHYRLSFECRSGRPRMASQPVLGVEIVAWRRWREQPRGWGELLGFPARSEIQQAWGDFSAAQLDPGSASMDFAVPMELSLEGGEEVLFGFNFLHLGNADLSIGAVDLRQLAPEEAAPPAAREWRMLGRLERGAIGRRDGECVAVRQAEPAMRLLHRGRPALQLPRGRYRLCFYCRVGLPQIKARPVLTIAIKARARSLHSRRLGWRSLFQPRSLGRFQHDFTAATLSAGSGSMNFDVPMELSLGGENDARFEIELTHWGNADVAITAINLEEITDAEEFLDDRDAVNVPTIHRSPSSRSPGRTKVLIIGNCQALTVQEALLRAGELNDRIEAKYHFVGLQKNLQELGKEELDNSDVLLVQEIKDWEHYPLRSYIRDDVQIIRFPLLHFASLWPFDHYNGPGDNEAYESEWPNLTFLYLDGLLARLRKEIPEPEQRLSAYRSLEVEGVINYVRLHDFEKRRLLAMDRQFGFEIGQFILDNFQRKQLFYTTNHPNGQISAMLIKHILKGLGIDRGYRPPASVDHLKRLQVPVHPKVAKALGVRWADHNTKYLYSGEAITWEDYVRRYINHYG